jgi:hypothetical protein
MGNWRSYAHARGVGVVHVEAEAGAGTDGAGNSGGASHRGAGRDGKEVVAADGFHCLLLSVSGWGRMVLLATLYWFIGAAE